jgi:hypothetical protein
VLSVLVYPPEETVEEGAASSDFYVLWIHANNPQLVELLESRGMPAYLVPGMLFEKPMQSLAVRVEVPWSLGAYELATTGFSQDFFRSHDNTYSHIATDGRRCRGDGAGPGRRGCLVRMDFVTPRRGTSTALSTLRTITPSSAGSSRLKQGRLSPGSSERPIAPPTPRGTMSRWSAPGSCLVTGGHKNQPFAAASRQDTVSRCRKRAGVRRGRRHGVPRP